MIDFIKKLIKQVNSSEDLEQNYQQILILLSKIEKASKKNVDNILKLLTSVNKGGGKIR